MIISFDADFKKLIDMGRNYPWPKPEGCPFCNGCRVWGHGFVLVCFDGWRHPIEMKRCRCPDCRHVFRFRPQGYFPRFQAGIETIRESIASKCWMGKWIAGIGRTRQRHWYNALIKQMKGRLTDVWDKGVLAAFDYLMAWGLVPVSRSI